MSLVNDALKKARIEAARGDIASRGVPYPTLGRGDHGSNRGWIAILGALVLLAGVSGFFLFRAGKQSALRANLAPKTQDSSIEAPVGATPVVETSASATRVASLEDALSDTSDVSDRVAVAPNSGRNRPASENPRDTGEPVSASAPPARAEPPVPNLERDNGFETAATNRQPTPRAAPNDPSTPRARADSASANDDAARETVPSPPRQPAVTTTRAVPLGPESSDSIASAVEYLRSADIPGIGPIELGGIAWSGDRPFALLNGRVLRPGDSILGLLVEEIQPNTVRLQGETGEFVFKLK